MGIAVTTDHAACESGAGRAAQGPAPDRALAPGQFRQRLIEAIACVRVEDTRLDRLFMARRCPQAMLRQYALATVRSADLFCAILAELADKAPDAEARLTMLENLMEEEGISLQPASGLVHRPETSHPALARRFAEAVGAYGDPRQAPHALAQGHEVLSRGEWVEAVSHLLVGQELHFAEAAPAIGKALMHNGLSARDVAFFLVHESADLRHGNQALDLVVKHANGRLQQERCIAEAHRGALAWLDAHGGLAVRPAKARGA